MIDNRCGLVGPANPCRCGRVDEVVATGDFYRFDRFAAPDALWDGLYPELLEAG